MKLKWTLDEQRFIKSVGGVEKGTIFEIDRERGRSFVKQGVAVEIKSKPKTKEINHAIR